MKKKRIELGIYTYVFFVLAKGRILHQINMVCNRFGDFVFPLLETRKVKKSANDLQR